MKNSRIKNIKDLCEYIWYLEDKYDLLNLEINGIHPWAAFRMDLYYEIGRKSGVFGKREKITVFGDNYKTPDFLPIS